MRTLALALVGAAVAAAGVLAQSAPYEQHARDIYKELVEINTTDTPAGSVTKAAEAMAARLRAAGFADADILLLGPAPNKFNLVARYRGTGAKRPMLLLAHLDVVDAKREDWSFDPFVFREENGWFYGRGTSDDKAMASQFVANLIRLKGEGFKPERDLILALTADEEGGEFNGAEWLVSQHRDLVDAEFAINEGGGGNMRNGKYLTNEIQAAEKVYQDFRLEVTNSGGHSSLPVKDNAIYHLAQGLARLEALEFPVQLSEITSTYFERSATVEADPAVAADMRAVAPNAGCSCRPTPVSEAAVLEFHDAHDVRRDAALRWARQQRATPTRDRQRQLPGPAGCQHRRHQTDDHRYAGRSKDYGLPRQGCAPESAGHASRGRAERRRVADQGDVPRRRRRSGDEHRRDRRPVLPQWRRPDVRRRWHVRRHRRCAGTRARRARGREAVFRGARV